MPAVTVAVDASERSGQHSRCHLRGKWRARLLVSVLLLLLLGGLGALRQWHGGILPTGDASGIAPPVVVQGTVGTPNVPILAPEDATTRPIQEDGADTAAQSPQSGATPLTGVGGAVQATTTDVPATVPPTVDAAPSVAADVGVESLPLCSNNPSGGNWSCPLAPATPQDPTVCHLSPAAWLQRSCQLMPPQLHSTPAEDVCATLASYDTVTFIGDSVTRGMWLGLLLQASTTTFRSTCEGTEEVPPSVQATTSCPFRPAMLRGKPWCDSFGLDSTVDSCCPARAAEEDPGIPRLYGSWSHAHKDAVKWFTFGDRQYCGGRLRAFYFVNEVTQGQRAVLHALRTRRGHHLIVMGGGIHMTANRRDAHHAGGALFHELYQRVLRAANVPECVSSSTDTHRRFTIVIAPMHYRVPWSPKALKRWSYQSNGVMAYAASVALSQVSHLYGAFSNAVPWDLYASLAAEDSSLRPPPLIPDSPPLPPNESRPPHPGVRLFVLDTKRVLRAMYEQCPQGQSPAGWDGTHVDGTGDMVKARLLLNLLVDAQALS